MLFGIILLYTNCGFELLRGIPPCFTFSLGEISGRQCQRTNPHKRFKSLTSYTQSGNCDPLLWRSFRNTDTEDIKVGDIEELSRENACRMVDGVVISGQTYVDESMMTGESVPVEMRCD